jgi:putative FmdB family regulatory protein
MPLYEYRCPSCAERFERLQPISAAMASPCPACGAPAPRVLSLTAARVGAGVGAGDAPAAGGGCCGGGCACC